MKVEYTLTLEDYAAAAAMRKRAQNSSGNLPWAYYVSMTPAILLVLCNCAFLVAKGLPWRLVAGGSLLVVVLFIVLFRLFRPLIIKLLMPDFARGLAERMSVEIRPEGLAVTPGPTSLIIWESIDRIVVNDTHAFFYVNKVGARILPRRVFANERDFEDFVENARSYQKAARLGAEAKQR